MEYYDHAGLIKTASAIAMLRFRYWARSRGALSLQSPNPIVIATAAIAKA